MVNPEMISAVLATQRPPFGFREQWDSMVLRFAHELEEMGELNGKSAFIQFIADCNCDAFRAEQILGNLCKGEKP